MTLTICMGGPECILPLKFGLYIWYISSVRPWLHVFFKSGELFYYALVCQLTQFL